MPLILRTEYPFRVVLNVTSEEKAGGAILELGEGIRLRKLTLGRPCPGSMFQRRCPLFARPILTVIDGSYPIRSSIRTWTVSPASLPIVFRSAALTGSLCVPSP